ncbi:methyl-accepting chemotaxis protein [Bacillus velezensis]|uniref:methyl-accepting chemotaxis protein n=1 Tax=Bacillus velezensis TaxID=492670 RepID=UPI00084A1883|nr:methyl-accepting chemotaxis protein [Bacillus velezensis]AOO60984.1 histidine kinase [Bacillus velezensis]
MTLRTRLLVNAAVTMICFAAVIGFTIVNMMKIQASNEDEVDALLNVQEAKADLNTLKESITGYSYTLADAQKEDVQSYMKSSSDKLAAFKKTMTDDADKAAYDKLAKKYESWQAEADAALDSKSPAEATRTAARINGLLNDIYMLNLKSRDHYEDMQKQTADQIQFIVYSAAVLTIVILAVTVISSIRLTKRIAGPIRRMAENARYIAAGNLAVEMLDYKGKDELKELNDSFGMMAEQLRTLIQAIGEVGREVETFAEGLTKENQTLKDMTEQVSVSTEEMAQGSQTISEDLQHAVQFIEQMDEHSKANAERSKQTTRSSEETIAAVAAGRGALAETKQAIDKSNETSKEISEAADLFIEHAAGISMMAQTVSDIAGQTNLLSLNAAIEAARAGEAGKGFAVVAEEIRKLADGSAKATAQIFDMVKQIEDGITSITGAVTTGVALADRQQELMEKTSESFAHIEQKAAHIKAELTQLDGRIIESKQLGEQVLHHAESISAVVQETAAGSEEISASALEQLSSFHKMAESVNNLVSLTERLNDQVRRFTL